MAPISSSDRSNPSHGSGRDRIAHRSLAERRQGVVATRVGSSDQDIAELACCCDGDAGGATAKSALVAGDPGFLEEACSGASVEYVFAHDLIREVAYESSSARSGEALHRRILAALETISAGREEHVAEALCHHSVKAQDWAKADRYAHLAARKAFARSAFRDATEYFKIAMDAVDKQPESTAREQRRSTCASKRGWRLRRLEGSSDGSGCVAMLKHAPRKFGMKKDGLRQ